MKRLPFLVVVATALALGLSFALSLAACSESPDEPTRGTPGTSCATMAASCAGRQSVCRQDSAGAYCDECARGSYASPAGECTPIGGTALELQFATFTVKPGEEIVDLCQSVTLHNEEEIWVHAVEMRQDEQSHHSIWTYVPDDKFAGPDGVWPCAERKYSNLVASLYGGPLYAQSTQSPREVQKFGSGAAIRIPPHARVIGSVHLLNLEEKAVTGSISLGIYQLPKAEVKVKLAPFELEFQDLVIPPRSDTELVAECDLGSAFASAGSPTVDMGFYYVLPHAHLYAKHLWFEMIGGDSDGKRVFDDAEYATYEPRGKSYVDPVRVKGARGIRFGCRYVNTLDRELVWGLEADKEMCQFLAYVDTSVAFSAYVDDGVTDISTPGDGSRRRFRAKSCRAVAVPWNQPAATP